ncbi:MAG: DUF2971 domain-containing protein [Bacteroidales bacterium]|nr:DUF2971 domain-containing protein [Bacteroidales bacterium]
MFISGNTLSDMEKILTEGISKNGSFKELEEKLQVYDKLPLLLKYCYAKFYFKQRNYQKASDIITYTINHFDELSTQHEFQIVHRTKLLIQIYGIAGEIYFMNGQNEESLKAFQDYHICLMRIKSDYFSEGLLSFRTYNEYSLSDLINNEITICSPRVMNDPYDTLIIKWGDYMREYRKDIEHINEYCDALNGYRIRSFSDIKDVDGKEMVGNIIMWSHYASQHTGFCVKYKFSQDFIKREERHSTIFKKISYKDSDESFTFKDMDSMDTDFALATKFHSWKYENEIRLVSYQPDVSGYFSSIPLDQYSHIECIYFGYRCPVKRIATIKRILSDKPDIKFFKMESDQSNIYNLVAKELV